MSVGVDVRNYTSRLTLTATTGLNGATVECSLAGTIKIGTDTISVGSKFTLYKDILNSYNLIYCMKYDYDYVDILYPVPFSPPPASIMMEISSTSSLTVSWTPPSDTSNVGGYMFTVTGQDCGCVSVNVSIDTTSVSCSGWTANDQTCSFEVATLSQDCGFISNTAELNINLVGESFPKFQQ